MTGVRVAFLQTDQQLELNVLADLIFFDGQDSRNCGTQSKCEEKFTWDEELPDDVKREWIQILRKVKDAEKVTFKRCIKPVNARGNPDLIICNDGSE